MRCDPVRERAVVGHGRAKARVVARQPLVRRRHEERCETRELLVRHRRRTAAQRFPFAFHVLREDRRRAFLHQDLDARLVLVVAAAEAVVHAQDRVQVVQDLRARQEFADHVADDRRAAEAAADRHAEAERRLRVADDQLQADVVDEDRGAIVGRAGHGDLELARQVRELRVERRPLPHAARCTGRGSTDLVAGDAREVVARDVADAVARGLDGVHLDPGELGQDVGHLLDMRPVELDVLARREVAVAAVVGAADVGERAQLPRRQLPVRDRDPQHWRMLLNIKAILQTQRAKLVVASARPAR